jgi:hypothetical protein
MLISETIPTDYWSFLDTPDLVTNNALQTRYAGLNDTKPGISDQRRSSRSWANHPEGRLA